MAHIIFWYHLLDIVADMLQCPWHPDLINMLCIARLTITTMHLDAVH
jgi:hypothetical protein